MSAAVLDKLDQVITMLAQARAEIAAGLEPEQAPAAQAFDVVVPAKEEPKVEPPKPAAKKKPAKRR